MTLLRGVTFHAGSEFTPQDGSCPTPVTDGFALEVTDGAAPMRVGVRRRGRGWTTPPDHGLEQPLDAVRPAE
jgi:hypothetical protein